MLSAISMSSKSQLSLGKGVPDTRRIWPDNWRKNLTLMGNACRHRSTCWTGKAPSGWSLSHRLLLCLALEIAGWVTATVVSAREQVLLNKKCPLVPQEALGASALDNECTVPLSLGSWISWMLCSWWIQLTTIAKYVCSAHVLLCSSSLFVN